MNGTDAPRPTWREFFETITTEPLSIGELATHFRCGRNHMRTVILPKLRAKQIGSQYLVVLLDMPLPYFVSMGLVHPFALNCTLPEKTNPQGRVAG